MDPKIIDKYSAPVPRYTSFPTAPHFHKGVDKDVYKAWLSKLGANDTLSLYIHIPFCDTLCWFCGCHTKMTRSYSPLKNYLTPLLKEIGVVASYLTAPCKVTDIHWGGGSPTILNAEHIETLAAVIKDCFQTDKNTAFAVEIDPRGMDTDKIDALTRAGVNRVSIGVQDFDPKVQAAINRVQTFDETVRVISKLRARGVTSVNIDMLYGLPHQTLSSIGRTTEQTLALAPDRIALFGYAHVPWMKRHQSMIDENTLPNSHERFEMAEYTAERLSEAGYVRIGFDHFAKPDDALSRSLHAKQLRRNFQGYTTDAAAALIGFGASAISSLPDGYVQNTVPTGDYIRQISKDGLAVEKGFALHPDDQLRAFVIEQLMCHLSFSRKQLQTRFGPRADPVIQESEDFVRSHHDGLIKPSQDGFTVTERGRPFLRSICAWFDPYLGRSGARHSTAV